ncbi:MAG TPA: Lrp/AsnC family transcriptional regulator [Pyrinomonadaceae bacterium]|jgi:Lrp/AsnC family leucine-responsive transcriptional regulator|nr:Lrp/AsnC family transcriptional regulator [Pyrinomonadaceae bacterium]
MIDGTDEQILTILQNDARIPNAEIARQIGLAPSAVLERIRKLEDRGVIRGYRTEIDPQAVEFGLTVFVTVKTTECGRDAEEALAAIPEVLEVHDVAGEDCFMLKIRTKDTDALGRLLREKIKTIPSVSGTRTTVVLETYKETNALPLEGKARKG